jgi:transcription elongation factor SPT6
MALYSALYQANVIDLTYVAYIPGPQAEIGEFLIRPSGKGLMNLSLTMKFFHDVFFHVEIKEGGKDGKASANNLKLGKPLVIDDQEYEDLDEVVARFVDPVVTNVKKVRSVLRK